MKGFLKFLATVVVSVFISCAIVKWWLHSGLPELAVWSVEANMGGGQEKATLAADGMSVETPKGTRIFIGVLDNKPAYKHTERDNPQPPEFPVRNL